MYIYIHIYMYIYSIYIGLCKREVGGGRWSARGP